MYRILVGERLKKQVFKESKDQLSVAISASKQSKSSKFTSVIEVGSVEGKVRLGEFPVVFNHKEGFK